jgi:MarR family 2-MHQ and catechol resistance regulon transcriptional repressor
MAMGTHYEGTEEEKRALNAFITLMRAGESLSARLSRDLAGKGLTMTQFGALEALLHLGPLCQRELGSKLLRSGGNITLVVDNLEKQGLIRRDRDGSDRRYVTVNLTPEGRRLIERVFREHLALIVEAMAVLSPREQENLRRLCRRLGLAVKDHKRGTEPPKE